MCYTYRAFFIVLTLYLLSGCAKNPQKHFDNGDTYFDQGMYSEAIEEYKKAIDIKPDWALAHNNLGLVYEKINKDTLAIQEYTKALRLDPNLAEAHYNLASVYYDQRSYTQAIDAYKRALQIDPNMAEAHYNLGAAYYETRQYDLARKEAIEAQKLGYNATALLDALDSVSP
jgi:tetratricopeptide (TPR) repeat protein